MTGWFDGHADRRARWLSRYAAFALASGVDADAGEKTRAIVEAHLPTLGPA